VPIVLNEFPFLD
jgi:hypothetical protein